eukprot:20101-Heterococcus_DN1.PRE.2
MTFEAFSTGSEALYAITAMQCSGVFLTSNSVHHATHDHLRKKLLLSETYNTLQCWTSSCSAVK